MKVLILGGDPEDFVSEQGILDKVRVVCGKGNPQIYVGPAEKKVWDAIETFTSETNLNRPRPMEEAAQPYHLLLVVPPLTDENAKIVHAAMKHGTNMLYLYESSDFDPVN